MRRILFVACAALLISVNGRAQQASSTEPSGTEGLACFENLATPEYPRSALQSNVDGSIWTWTQVGPQGTIDKIDTQVVSAWSQADKLLTPVVEKAIRASKIKAECAGKKVWVVFRYDVRGEPITSPTVNSRTDGPNLIWIESHPEAKAQT